VTQHLLIGLVSLATALVLLFVGVFGAVPLVGDAFDVLWRANRRNMRLLREWLEGEGARF
jgi:hypothetical protein